MVISPFEHDTSLGLPDPAELLIKEARRRQRRRHFVIAVALAVLLVATIGLSAMLSSRQGVPHTTTDTPPPPLVASVPSLARGSGFWTMDMLTSRTGFAVAGISSARTDEQLLRTTNSGKAWSVVAQLPYSYEAAENKPLLHFVTPSIGYTQSLTTNAQPIYLTTNGGKSWQTISILGRLPQGGGASTSPAVQFSNGVVSLVSEQCRPLKYSSTCSATLSEYHWGALTPYLSNPVTPFGTYPKGIAHHWSLLVASSPSTALVVEQSSTRVTPTFTLASTTNGGRSWSPATNPCVAKGQEPPPSFNALALTTSRWFMNCSWYTGAGPTTVLLRDSVNDGRTWSTVDYNPAFGVKNAESIGGETNNVWSSNEGSILWSYSMSGVRVSTDGGHTWSRIAVVGNETINNVGGGGQLAFASVGPTGAYLVSTTGQIYRSYNGTTFIPVRLDRQS